jgi:hypothetical protein
MIASSILLCHVSESVWVQIAECNVCVTVEYSIALGSSTVFNLWWILVASTSLRRRDRKIQCCSFGQIKFEHTRSGVQNIQDSRIADAADGTCTGKDVSLKGGLTDFEGDPPISSFWTPERLCPFIDLSRQIAVHFARRRGGLERSIASASHSGGLALVFSHVAWISRRSVRISNQFWCILINLSRRYFATRQSRWQIKELVLHTGSKLAVWNRFWSVSLQSHGYLDVDTVL